MRCGSLRTSVQYYHATCISIVSGKGHIKQVSGGTAVITTQNYMVSVVAVAVAVVTAVAAATPTVRSPPIRTLHSTNSCSVNFRGQTVATWITGNIIALLIASSLKCKSTINRFRRIEKKIFLFVTKVRFFLYICSLLIGLLKNYFKMKYKENSWVSSYAAKS